MIGQVGVATTGQALIRACLPETTGAFCFPPVKTKVWKRRWLSSEPIALRTVENFADIVSRYSSHKEAQKLQKISRTHPEFFVLLCG
jgi:hypothetical protein